MPRKKSIRKKRKTIKRGQRKASAKTAKTTRKPRRTARQIKTVRGMRDILPSEQPYWQRVRRVVDKVATDYDYGRIDFPVVEFHELFERTTGMSTDILEKEMFKFKTKGRDLVALRPEGTPSVMRAYLQDGMQSYPKPVKLFYIGKMYRYDRPQKDRWREFSQFGFEAIGEQDPILDAQLIQLALRIFHLLKIKNVTLQINSIGCKECRPNYTKLLINYLKNRRRSLCMDCKKRLTKNPLRVLDCKEEKCRRVVRQAPQTIDHLCKDCKDHFTQLLECLDEIEVVYQLNPSLVRGLDYYTKTVFEFWAKGEDEDDDGSQVALGGGGRYDHLAKILKGPDTPAVGFAVGMDRLVNRIKEQKNSGYQPPRPKVYLAQLGDLAKRKSLKIFDELERSGVMVAESFGKGGLKGQLRQADKMKTPLVLIIGQREALDETIILKDMTSGSQEVLPFEKAIPEIKKRVKRLIKKKYFK